MQRTITINSRRFESDGTFRIPFTDLDCLRFAEVPYYSIVEVTDLPTPKHYSLEMVATHGGGPHDEFFEARIDVHFTELKTRENAIQRRLQRIQKLFGPSGAAGKWKEVRDGLRLNTAEYWITGVSYYKKFHRSDNPVLKVEFAPFIVGFQALAASRDVLLFLCHASEDKLFVDDFAAFLDSQEIPTWYDKREIRLGQSIVERINDGLQEASHLVVVLSNQSVVKTWVRKELSVALMSQLQSKAITVIPVKREPCELPLILADIKYLNAFPDQKAAFKQMVAEIL